MRVLFVHNYYQQPGGEDRVFAAESALMEARGHDVFRFTVNNRALDGMSPPRAAAAALWNHEMRRSLRRQVQRLGVEVVHFHNTFPLVSAAGWSGARSGGAAVVQTLHNFRVACPSALFFRDREVCEDCIGRAYAWPGVVHACYRNSRTATATVALMQTLHRTLGSWRQVDRLIALNDFAREKFIEAGLPAARVVVKPNFLLMDPGAGAHDERFTLFVGRLSAEKGIETLLAAWRRLDDPPPLHMVGDGPLAGAVRAAAESQPSVTWRGQLPAERVMTLMRSAFMTVLPSACYESFPMVLVEAFATGLPVVASDLGAMSALIENGVTGLLFPAGEAAQLAERISWAYAHPGEVREMGKNCRRSYLQSYTGDRNYRQLLEIYERALARRSRGLETVESRGTEV